MSLQSFIVYLPTPIGERLRPILNSMFDWGIDYVGECGEFMEGENCEPKLSDS